MRKVTCGLVAAVLLFVGSFALNADAASRPSRVSDSEEVFAGAEKTIEVRCARGFATGGGFNISADPKKGGTPEGRVVSSQPSPDGRGWVIGVRNEGAETIRAAVVAVCVR